MTKETPNFSVAQNQPVLSAILSRRDIRIFTDQSVENKDLEEIIYAAIWAPNHKMTEPYKFTVIQKEKVPEFVEVLAQGLLEEASTEAQKADFLKTAQKIRTDFVHIPAFIAVACPRNPDPAIHSEDLLTVGCACQNMLLAAEEKGLGAHWGSGFASKTKKVREYLGFTDNDISIGLFQLGYPKEKPQTRRSPLSKFLTWK